MAKQVVKLSELSASEVPPQLRVDHYFDLETHPFEHRALFAASGNQSVVSVLPAIADYARTWLSEAIAARAGQATEVSDISGIVVGKVRVLLEKDVVFAPSVVIGPEAGGTLYVSAGARLVGCSLWVDEGDIFIGPGTTVEPGAGIKGPCIVGRNCVVRQGAYFRGNVITGDEGTFRGELKNVVMMDGANFPHPGYVGDSLCGFKTHFGNQATSANLGIYYLVGGKNNITLNIGGVTYYLGRPKVGIIVGDYSQVGCNSVSDPGTFLAPHTIIYQLSRINKGLYGPNEVLKNKPIEHGIIERTPFRPL